MSYRRKAVCTICSNNYLHFARTLMDSLREAEPDWDRYLLLCDENNDVFDVSKEPFNVVELASLPLPNPRAFCFRYTILELNTAVKPWFLEWLFEVKKYDQVVYLDPDVYVYAPMRDVEEALETGSFLVLTPHLTGRLDDDAEPTEHDILKAGAYNLGFVALRSRENLSPFLKWWQEKVEFNCAIDFEGGLFVDQKWIDLVPGMFGGVVILRHDGYNVAYWNLRHRKVTRREGNFYVNGQRLVFFHFSGLDPPAPKPFSKHQDRFRLRNLGAAKQLVRSYSKTVIENGLERCRTWPYAFERFTDGTPILDCMRYYYRRHIESRRRSSRDPFALGHDYFHRPWAGADRRGPLITLLMRAVWEYRQDLQEYFPAIEGDAAWDYAYWFTEGIAQGLDLPDCCVAPVRRSLQSERGAESRKKRHRSPGGLVPSGASGLTRLAGLALPRGAKHWVKQLLIPGVRAMSGLQHATRRAARLVPKRTRHRIRALLEATVGALRPEAPALPKPFLPGAAFKEAAPAINIIGYLRAEHGVGEVPRLCAAACEAVYRRIPRAGRRQQTRSYDLQREPASGQPFPRQRRSDAQRVPAPGQGVLRQPLQHRVLVVGAAGVSRRVALQLQLPPGGMGHFTVRGGCGQRQIAPSGGKNAAERRVFRPRPSPPHQHEAPGEEIPLPRHVRHALLPEQKEPAGRRRRLPPRLRRAQKRRTRHQNHEHRFLPG